ERAVEPSRDQLHKRRDWRCRPGEGGRRPRRPPLPLNQDPVGLIAVQIDANAPCAPIRHVPAPPVDADPATTSSDLRRGSLARGSRASGPGRCPETERSAPELAPLGWSGGYRL